MKRIKWTQCLHFIVGIFSFLQIAYAEDTPLLIQAIESVVPTLTEIEKSTLLLKDKKKVKLLDNLTLAPFHQRNKSPIKNTDQVYCNGCHLSLPHSKSLRTRTFMNMHSEYIACESCHFKSKNKELSYRWFDYQKNTEAEKKSGRLHSGHPKNTTTALIPRTGQLKIAPFYQNKPVLITQAHPYSKMLQQQWKKADLKGKARLHAKIHQPLLHKGTACMDCHTQTQDLLQLKSLADSPAQAQAIQQNTIADFFKHYQSEKPLAAGELPPLEQRIKMIDLLN